jgi:kynureninase
MADPSTPTEPDRMLPEPSSTYARHRDSLDALAGFRSRFALPTDRTGAPLLYLCGHSLGLMPLEARDIVNEELDDWAHLGVQGHEKDRRDWISYADNLRSDLAELVGAAAEEVVAMNSLTINLHLMLAAFFQPQGRRTRIVIESGAFSSDRHAAASALELRGLDPSTHLLEIAPAPGEDLVNEDAIDEVFAARGGEIALVLWPGVQFRTGQSFDLARIARSAHRAGATVGFDLAHSIGNVPVSLRESGGDFAVWCSYKYLNGGPGAIGGCFVHPRHFDVRLRPRLSGWWGHDIATRFEMGPTFRASPGASGFQVSNPPILSSAPLVASLRLFREAGIRELRAKSVAMTGFLERLVDRHPQDVEIVTPRAPAARGAQLSLRIRGANQRGRRVFDWLAEHGAICDWRAPDIVRVAPVPLYNSFEDVFGFGERLAQALLANP